MAQFKVVKKEGLYVNPNMQKIFEAAREMTRDELRAANRLIIDRLKEGQRRRDFEESRKYSIGDEVEFEGRDGCTLRGKIKSVNQKARVWRVAYCHVRYVS